ncbi:MAG: hypothetical protein KDK40_04370, partial [Chlamydiia bacterium]|nr:hypothetical protein [Chlamydiia bacterium]
MEKQKPWQFALIVLVMMLTIFNIMPTIFYYMQPLRSPVDAPRAQEVALEIVERVDDLETDAIAWVKTYCKLLKIHPKSISIDPNSSRFINVTFEREFEAKRLKRLLPQAGPLIPFVPDQLELAKVDQGEPTSVRIERTVGVEIDPKQIGEFFHFSDKFAADGRPEPFYQSLIAARAENLAKEFTGTSSLGDDIQHLLTLPKGDEQRQLAISVARRLSEPYRALQGVQAKGLLERIYTNAGQFERTADAKTSPTKSLTAIFKPLKEEIASKLKESEGAGKSRDEQIGMRNQLKSLEQALLALSEYGNNLDGSPGPLPSAKIDEILTAGFAQYDPAVKAQRIDLQGHHPYVEALRLSWGEGVIYLDFYPDVQAIRLSDARNELTSFAKGFVGQQVVDSIATASRKSDEVIAPRGDGFAVDLSTLSDSHSFLAFNLSTLAQKRVAELSRSLDAVWQPGYIDLQRNVFPISTWKEYQALPKESQRLGLVFYAPVTDDEGAAIPGFEKGSIYIIGKGLNDIIRRFQEVGQNESSAQLAKDFESLKNFLTSEGFIGYSGESLGTSSAFAKDLIFRLPNYYDNFLMATRENFSVKGDK